MKMELSICIMNDDRNWNERNVTANWISSPRLLFSFCYLMTRKTGTWHLKAETVLNLEKQIQTCRVLCNCWLGCAARFQSGWNKRNRSKNRFVCKRKHGEFLHASKRNSKNMKRTKNVKLIYMKKNIWKRNGKWKAKLSYFFLLKRK